ncbi:YheC/YheD family protein [Bacillus sp. FJAT-29790]|uniref:YheC/YheD family protein n=1 Tax=Bacillus sp. FJAT-29790 TaxID=1895002 RepID=UPI001C21EA41|nr:YheC/YheD family protein [Bacillus sp. FJAT-29790]MBU8878802.1 YheC/YheD family protein [Bacillus sp. FJAT-29790]
MVHKVGKLEQYRLLNASQIPPGCLPTTAEYSLKNLKVFLTKFNVIYIKHDTSGQGRGVFKVTKGQNQIHTLNGFSMQGKAISQELRIEQIHKLLQPFERLGKLNPYIIQEGIQSFLKSGQPFSIRVHVQFVNGKWKIAGMYAMISTEQLKENGIANNYRGSQVFTTQNLMRHYLKLNSKEERDLLAKIRDISIRASEAMAKIYPSREYGIDVGLHKNFNPMIFEVNNTPSIRGFYHINPQLWHSIVKIRKSL